MFIPKTAFQRGRSARSGVGWNYNVTISCNPALKREVNERAANEFHVPIRVVRAFRQSWLSSSFFDELSIAGAFQVAGPGDAQHAFPITINRVGKHKPARPP
jgi:hypothetical protein